MHAENDIIIILEMGNGCPGDGVDITGEAAAVGVAKHQAPAPPFHSRFQGF